MMTNLTTLTLTGIDQRSDIADLKALIDEYPFLELGVLYSAKRQGQDNRYPDIDLIREFGAAFKDRCSLHVCGSYSRVELYSCAAEIESTIATGYSRIQINGEVHLESLRSVINTYLDVVSPARAWGILNECGHRDLLFSIARARVGNSLYEAIPATATSD